MTPTITWRAKTPRGQDLADRIKRIVLDCWFCKAEITDTEPMLIVGGHTVHEACLKTLTTYAE